MANVHGARLASVPGGCMTAWQVLRATWCSVVLAIAFISTSSGNPEAVQHRAHRSPQVCFQAGLGYIVAWLFSNCSQGSPLLCCHFCSWAPPLSQSGMNKYYKTTEYPRSCACTQSMCQFMHRKSWQHQFSVPEHNLNRARVVMGDDSRIHSFVAKLIAGKV